VPKIVLLDEALTKLLQNKTVQFFLRHMVVVAAAAVKCGGVCQLERLMTHITSSSSNTAAVMDEVSGLLYCILH